MGSSKRLRKQRWVKVFDLLIDNSRGYCLGDLIEEYEERCKRQGKLKSIVWLCREMARSRSYLISYSHLRAWLTGLWSRIAVAIRSFRMKAAKLILRPQIAMPYLAFSVLFAAFVFLSQPQLQQRTNSQTAILVPRSMARSDGGPIPRIAIDPTVSVMRFELALPFEEAELLYEVTLSNLDRELLVVKGIKPVNNKLSISIPASLFQTGDYVLNASPGSNSRRYSYFFRVTSAAQETR